MKLKSIIKEELNRQEYLYALAQKVGDEKTAKFYLDSYCDLLNKMNQQGGDIYKLIYDTATRIKKVTNWTMSKDSLLNKIKPGIFIAKAQISAGNIDVENSLKLFMETPKEDQIALVRPPDLKKIVRVK